MDNRTCHRMTNVCVRCGKALKVTDYQFYIEKIGKDEGPMCFECMPLQSSNRR